MVEDDEYSSYEFITRVFRCSAQINFAEFESDAYYFCKILVECWGYEWIAQGFYSLWGV